MSTALISKYVDHLVVEHGFVFQNHEFSVVHFLGDVHDIINKNSETTTNTAISFFNLLFFFMTSLLH